ncbi:hypothetical protein BDR05DRAFT_871015, partial [Suillus weaverae]
HTSLHNIIKHIFSIMKQQWHILQLPSEYKMDFQANISVALCALHNFICRYDPTIFDNKYDEDLLGHELEDSEAAELNELGDGPADTWERWRADVHCDAIARAMWDNYVAVCAA